MEKKKRILLVDDEEIVRNFGSTALSGAGYEVETATGGDDALSKYVRSEGSAYHDLILSDVQMPGTNGIALVRAIRAIRPEQKVIFASGLLAEGLLEVGIEVPIDVPLLHKPFRVAELIRTVRDVLA